MAYKAGVGITNLPKRKGARGRPFDQKSADALYEIARLPGSTATDGESYDDVKEARKQSGKARRLITRKLEQLKLDRVVKTQVFEDAGKHRWEVYIAPVQKGSKPKTETAEAK